MMNNLNEWGSDYLYYELILMRQKLKEYHLESSVLYLQSEKIDKLEEW
jgi:hypothetical protein